MSRRHRSTTIGAIALSLVATTGVLTFTSSTAHAETTYSEQEGHHGVNTFTNYHNASGVGQSIAPAASVAVSCKVYDPTIVSANPDGYWYRIASSPWNDQYYAPANTFMNGDPWNGPYTHNTDFNVPDCGSIQVPPPVAPTYINGVNVGYPQNAPHNWGGGCVVQDFKGGPYGWVIVGYSHGTQIVRNGMLWGWFDNGGGPGIGCPTNQEHAYSNGVRQDFSVGSMYWTAGMDHAKRVEWRDAPSLLWSGYALTSTRVTGVAGSWTVPSITCSAVAGPSVLGMWVGVDGTQGSNDLVQGGVLASCNSAAAAPTYRLFWQKVPYGNGHSILLGTVRPGDSVAASVAYGLNNSYTISLSVNGHKQAPIRGVFSGGTHTTAECVIEAPLKVDSRGKIAGTVALAGFTSMTFNSCTVSSSGGNGYPLLAATDHGAQLWRYDMNLNGSSSGRLRATPGLPVSAASTWSVFRRSS